MSVGRDWLKKADKVRSKVVVVGFDNGRQHYGTGSRLYEPLEEKNHWMKSCFSYRFLTE